VTTHEFLPSFPTIPISFILPSQQELNNNCAKVSHKQGRSAQDKNETKSKHSKESEYWLNQTSLSNQYTALLEEESEDQQNKDTPENTLKPPAIYITGIENISTLIQLLEKIAKQKYKIKSLQDNQVKGQFTTSDWNNCKILS
jgi:hypothetical protein